MGGDLLQFPHHSHPEPNMYGQLRTGDLVIDRDAWTVSWEGAEIPLSAQAFRLLSYLAAHPGKVLTRGQLIERCWPPYRTGDTRSVDVHVRWLRGALWPVTGARIVTVRGVGYRWDQGDGVSMGDRFTPPIGYGRHTLGES